MKRTPLKRKTSLRPNSYADALERMRKKGPRKQQNPKARQPLRNVGKRGEKRAQMNRELNKLGIEHCEIHLPMCWRRYGLTWAHSKKSRLLVTDEDWMEAARACLQCHQKIEVMKHEEMKSIVLAAIASRVTTMKEG